MASLQKGSKKFINNGNRKYFGSLFYKILEADTSCHNFSLLDYHKDWYNLWGQVTVLRVSFKHCVSMKDITVS